MKEKRSQMNKIGFSIIAILVFIFLNISGCAAGFLGIGDTASWKEEVLLHDGSKIIVERWQKHGGRHEPGQEPDISDQSITFTIPSTNKTIKWTDEYSEDIGRSNFRLVSLHILNTTPYIITTPRLCLSYNKWGRPNPPYVIFKYVDPEWKRIELEELPTEFKNINLVIETDGYEKKLVSQDLVSMEMVKELNNSQTQEEFKTIIRTPIKIWCQEMITNGRGGWMDSSGFKKLPSYGACLNECKKVLFDMKYCPCDKLFKTSTKEK